MAVKKAAPIQVATTSMAYVYKLLKSVAIAKVIAQGATNHWVPAKSLVLDIFYGFWKEKPGSEEVDIPRLKQVEPEVLEEFARLVKAYTALTGQVLAQQSYLQRMVMIRGQFLDNLASRIRGAQAVNEKVGREALAFAEDLKGVVVVSTVALACCGFYITVGALTGGTVLVLPCGLGPMAVLPATYSAISGGMTAAGATTWAACLTGVGATASAMTQAEMSAYIKVIAVGGIHLLGDKVPELVEKYDPTITGEKKVIQAAEEEIRRNEVKLARLGRAIKRTGSSSARVAKKVVLKTAIEHQQAVVEAGEKIIQKRVAPWAAGAKFVPLLCASYELQHSMGELFEYMDEKTVDQ